MSARRAALAALMLGACTPLTFSNTAPVDFTRYRSVYVAPLVIDRYELELHGLSPRDYLIEGLNAGGGFARVDRDPGVVDTHLYVELRVQYDDGFDREDHTYRVTATFELSTPDGRVIDRGQVEDDDSDLYEAVEDALDELVHHYLPSYRL